MEKEEKINGWIVREPVIGHFLTFFRKKPVGIKSNHWIDEDGNVGAALADYENDLFNEIETETGPIEIELTLKRKDDVPDVRENDVKIGDVFSLCKNNPFNEAIYSIVTDIKTGEDGKLYVKYSNCDCNGNCSENPCNAHSGSLRSFLLVYEFVKHTEP